MDKELVDSSGIDWLRYDEVNRTLDVAYASSGEYRYFDVDRDVYEWLRKAQSKGKFINRLVKGKYRYERIDRGHSPAEDADLAKLHQDSLDSRSKSED
jgi:hypothetical protein